MKTQCSRHSLINFKSSLDLPKPEQSGREGLVALQGRQTLAAYLRFPLLRPPFTPCPSDLPPHLHPLPGSLRPTFPWLLWASCGPHGLGSEARPGPCQALFIRSPGLLQQERQVTRCAFQIDARGTPGRGGLGGSPLRERGETAEVTKEGLRLRPPGPGPLYSPL